MATLTSFEEESPGGVGIATWSYDCGHEDRLFYGGKQFAEADKHIGGQTKCLACCNQAMLASYVDADGTCS